MRRRRRRCPRQRRRQKGQRADDVVVIEGGRVLDRLAHLDHRREVQDRPRLVPRKNLVKTLPVTNIALFENAPLDEFLVALERLS